MSALSQSGKKSTSRPRISDQLKIRILEEYKQLGWKPTQIAKNVNERGYACHSTTILRLLQKYEKTEIIQRTLDENAETTTTEMQKVLDDHGYSLHLRTIVRARRKLGWLYRNARYCQHVRPKNIEARLQWAIKIYDDMKNGFNFDDVIFTDETKIQLESYTKKCYRRSGFPAELKGKFKHPQSVLVWGGISRRGRSKILIFSGLMDADFYVNEVLMKGLLEFGSCKYDGQYKLMQDNVGIEAAPIRNAQKK